MSKTQYIILKERIAKESSRSGIVFVFELVCLVFGMLYFAFKIASRCLLRPQPSC